MTGTKDEHKKQRASHLRWVPIAEMKVSPKAQREFRKPHAEKFAADFDLEALGFPVVNIRDGHYWIVDGQHRVEALKMMGWADQQIQCECYEGMTEAEEADLFLRRDDRRAITSFDKFRCRGRPRARGRHQTGSCKDSASESPSTVTRSRSAQRELSRGSTPPADQTR